MLKAPELSWQTIIAALTAVALISGAEWTIFQNQFANVEKTAATDRATIVDIKASLANYLSIREHNEFQKGIKSVITDIQRRLSIIEEQLIKSAHDPVEAKTFEAVSKATDDRVSLLQNQITDINRQIAAALIIIDNNAPIRKNLPPP